MFHIQGAANGARRGHSKNKQWIAGQDGKSNGRSSEGERWERGGAPRRARSSRKPAVPNPTHLSIPTVNAHEDIGSGTDEDRVAEEDVVEDEQFDADPENPEERERFYHELVKAREVERKRAIAEGKMDDPGIPKRLEEAITIVGTCVHMCPRFERFRRERENNLDKWEVIPGTKRVDHKRAVKKYERAVGDKTLPSDLRPPPVLKKTLDYLFHDLLVKEGFSQTHDFIRDRSRAVRSDFTMQHETGPLAIECHDRCARYHILAIHLERGKENFSLALEEEQLMKTLQSLKEFYEDQRGRYQAPTELEMRVYHRLIHIRDQRERHEDIPEEITSHPVFQLTTKFRARVQEKSAPIKKNSTLIVDAGAMQIFAELAAVLRQENNIVMIYLVACIMERLFGKDTIDDIDAICGDLSIPEIIDGISKPLAHNGMSRAVVASPVSTSYATTRLPADFSPKPDATIFSKSTAGTFGNGAVSVPTTTSSTIAPSAFSNLASTPSSFGTTPVAPSSKAATSAFSNLGSSPNAFTSTTAPATSAFGNLTTKAGIFGGAVFGVKPSTGPSVSPFGSAVPKSFFGGTSTVPTPPSFGSAAISPAPTSFGSPPNGSAAPPTSFGLSSAEPTTAPPFGVSSSAGSSTLTPSFTSPPSFNLSTVSTPLGVSSVYTAPQSPSPFNQLPPPAASTSMNGAAIPSESPFRLTAPPPASPFLNPFAPTFQPTSFTPSVGVPVSPTSVPPVLVEHPEPKLKKPSEVFLVPPINIPSGTRPTTVSPPHEAPADETAQPTPSRIIERSQTLWEFPGTPRTPLSPRAPPALEKVQPISLPPTPTARWFDPTSQPRPSELLLSRKKSMLGFPPLQIPPSTSAELLSPLHLPSPVGAAPSPVPSGSLSPLIRVPAPVLPVPGPSSISAEASAMQRNGKIPSSSKGKAKETAEDLDAQATAFLRRSSVVKKHFKTWVRRTTDRAEWLEACERSELYKEKLRRERLASGLGSGHTKAHENGAQKTRRAPLGLPGATPSPRRPKRRAIHHYLQPLTDEALAQRLKENHEENERRWAQGSFLGAVRSQVKDVIPRGTDAPEWRIWLSMNPGNDQTAIWLEHKFDVPASGDWVSEDVFSIPALKRSPGASGSPGLIVFERTPMQDIDDELERKYRILDDCSRLRDIVQCLPPDEKLHFVPCLVIVNWVEDDKNEKTRDFDEMLAKLLRDGIIKQILVFNIPPSATDLDGKFQQLLADLSMDVEDRLSHIISWKEITHLFIDPVETAITDWLDSCWIDDTFDYTRYEQVLQASEILLNEVTHQILSLLGLSYDASLEIPSNLQQSGYLGKGYAIGPFVDALVRLPVKKAEQLLGEKLRHAYVLPTAEVDSYLRHIEEAAESQAEQLRLLAVEAARRRSPKRRATDEYPDDESPPAPNKRMRTSSSSDGYRADIDGLSASPPPSTSASTAAVTDAGEKPLVTVAMLRALTRDVLKTYART